MRAKIAQFLLVLTLSGAIGGHWAVLQSVAWVSMTVEFSQTESLAIALEKTFNGKNPCKLCKAVQEGKDSERKQESTQAEQKLDFWCPLTPAFLFSPACHLQVAELDRANDLRFESPPSPPPRLS